jgi:hypothetical protein
MSVKSIHFIQLFHDNFYHKYFNILGNPILKNISNFSENELFSSPNILLYGNHVTILKLFLDSILMKIFNIQHIKRQSASYDCTVNNNKQSFSYNSSDIFIEIDLQCQGSGEKQFLCDFVGDQILTTKNIKHPKHIIILHNLQKASDQTIFALRKLMERHSHNALFIITCPSLSKINEPIKSRCMLVRCNLDIDNVATFFETFIEECDLDDDVVVEIEDTDIMKKIIQIASPSINDGFVPKTIHAFLDKILKTTSISTLMNETKAFGFKILHLNIEFKNILKICIDYFSQKKKYSKYMCDIVSLAADTELKSLHVNKSFVLFENFIYKIYRMIVLNTT